MKQHTRTWIRYEVGDRSLTFWRGTVAHAEVNGEGERGRPMPPASHLVLFMFRRYILA